MLVYLFSLLLATSTWSGVWEITAEKMQGGVNTYYLVIDDEESAELYDHEWYPQIVMSCDLDETTIKMGLQFEGVFVPTRLEGQLNDGRLNGTIIFNFPQYEIKGNFSAERVSAIPIPLPADYIPGTIEGRTVNIVKYLVEKAPKESFDEFLRFWHEDVVPRYFVLLESLLRKSGEETEKTLQKVFESLEKLEEKATERLESDSGTDADYTVLVPAAEDREPMTIEVYSGRKEWPPDYKPCCGNKLFNLKKFRLVTVAP